MQMKSKTGRNDGPHGRRPGPWSRGAVGLVALFAPMVLAATPARAADDAGDSKDVQDTKDTKDAKVAKAAPTTGPSAGAVVAPTTTAPAVAGGAHNLQDP